MVIDRGREETVRDGDLVVVELRLADLVIGGLQIDLALASALADLYGTTTDCLAGRRLSRQSLPALAPDRY